MAKNGTGKGKDNVASSQGALNLGIEIFIPLCYFMLLS